MDSQGAPLTLDNTSIFVLDNPTLHTYEVPLSKADFINSIANPIIMKSPKLAIIWKEILQEPLSKGYITWGTMITLMVSLYKHDHTYPSYKHRKEAHLLITQSLFYCRTIHFPPLPGGEDADKPFANISRAKIPNPYDYFETNIFKDMDAQVDYRNFPTIRLSTRIMKDDEERRISYRLGTRAYTILEALRALPPSVEEPEDSIPPGI